MELYGCASVFEPLFFLAIEMGRKGGQYLLMVIVEPCNFLRQQQFFDNWPCINRTEGKTLELEELSEFCLLVRDYQKGVFYSHSKLALQVDARLISYGHTCH